MAILEFLPAGRRNTIILGGAGTAGFVISTIVALGFIRPAVLIQNTDGERLMEITTGGAILVGTGSTPSGTLGQCLQSGGSSGSMMSWGSCGSGGGGVNTGGILLVADGRFVNVAGDTMTGALTIKVKNGTNDTQAYEAPGISSGYHLHAQGLLTASGTVSVDGASRFDNTVVINESSSGEPFLISDSKGNALQFDNGGYRDLIIKGENGSNALEFFASSIDEEYNLQMNPRTTTGGFFQVKSQTTAGGMQMFMFSAIRPIQTLDLVSIQYPIGNIDMFRISNSGAVNVNPSNNDDSDFQAEGRTDSSLFFVDASADKVGVGTATPETKLEVEGTMSGFIIQSSGTISGSGNLSIDAAMSGRSLFVGGTATLGIIKAFNMLTDGGICYSDGTNLQNTAAGSSGQWLMSQGTGVPIWKSIEDCKTYDFAPPSVQITAGTGSYFPVAFSGTVIKGFLCTPSNTASGFTVNLERSNGTSVFSTPLTVDKKENCSDTAATPAVVNASNAKISLFDRVRIEVPTVGTHAASGAYLIICYNRDEW